MPSRTRSGTSSPVKKAQVMVPSLPDEDNHDPVKMLIAPTNISTTARIISLRHPTDRSYRRFLYCSQKGLHELKKTTTAVSDPRSILFAPQSLPLDKAVSTPHEDGRFSDGYLNKQAELLTATPYDLAFILLSVVAPQTTTTKKSLFQPIEDLLDAPENDDKNLRYILRDRSDLVRDSMSRICDKVEAGDEEMYRYNEDKVLKWVLKKAHNVVESGLPASLEERFVTRVVEAPILNVKREDTTVSIALRPTTGDEITSQDESFDSQSTTTTTVSAVFSQTSTTSTVVTEIGDGVPAGVKQLQRLRTAFNFIAATCLPPFVTLRLTSMLLEASSPIDFQPLEVHLKQLAALRAEAAASRSLSDFSRKRSLEEEEAAEDRAEKKRKQEEDEKKRKANESRGVRDLKKVNVAGMKKMSDFFGKKPTTTKTKS